MLHDKGIEYAGLRKALTPQSDRLEAGFVFDTVSGKQMNNFADVLIPLLDRRSGCSILRGDLIHPNQELAGRWTPQAIGAHNRSWLLGGSPLNKYETCFNHQATSTNPLVSSVPILRYSHRGRTTRMGTGPSPGG